MSIIETGLQFGTLYPLDSVTHIVLHHAAGNGSAKVSLQYAYIDENGIGDGDFISFTPADAEIFQVKDGQFSFSADL